jgi:hypothetical protein
VDARQTGEPLRSKALAMSRFSAMSRNVARNSAISGSAKNPP